MRSIYALNCKNCKYEKWYYLGTGSRHMGNYKIVVKRIQAGAYGKEWQEFLDNNPGAVVFTYRKLYQCPKCNRLQDDYDMSLYVNINGLSQKIICWDPWINPEEYKLAKKYIHKCPECAIEMDEKPAFNNKNIYCPRCGEAAAPVFNLGLMEPKFIAKLK